MKFLGFTLGALGFVVLVLLVTTAGFDESASGCGVPNSASGSLSGGGDLSVEAAANAGVIIEAGRGVPVEAQQIAIAVALVESDLVNVAGGDRDSIGLFQQRPSQGWGTPEQISDPNYSAAKFYEALLGLEGWETLAPGDAAQRVQRSAFPARYGQAMPEARRVHAELTKSGSDTQTPGEVLPVDCSVGAAGAATGDQLKVDTAGGSTITVDSSLAPALQQLLNDAAAEGIVLGGWGWRDPQSQISLRKKHCGTSQYAVYEMPSSQCSPPTARPGRSQHEIGLAVDFTCNGAPMAGTTCFRWLQNNAVRYGMKNLPSEPWHWSTTGR